MNFGQEKEERNKDFDHSLMPRHTTENIFWSMSEYAFRAYKDTVGTLCQGSNGDSMAS